MTDQEKRNGSMLDKANAAFEQAAVKLIERARQTRTPIVVWDDGKVKEIAVDEFEASITTDRPSPPTSLPGVSGRGEQKQ
jgi:hypothetical protein